ncbi:hypothetical protein JVT61DRAFT_7136 [Boletus reticuloceps]|uniref:Uncharacterized protein n=1 Tax=Boletus reticuloceps TaxID=495285 RepID=A0A8I2YJE4_9AGAM|nr:hypothetical protein JVT61DRAFT_7136 [Boletus reticuloceps]
MPGALSDESGYESAHSHHVPTPPPTHLQPEDVHTRTISDSLFDVDIEDSPIMTSNPVHPAPSTPSLQSPPPSSSRTPTPRPVFPSAGHGIHPTLCAPALQSPLPSSFGTPTPQPVFPSSHSVQQRRPHPRTLTPPPRIPTPANLNNESGNVSRHSTDIDGDEDHVLSATNLMARKRNRDTFVPDKCRFREVDWSEELREELHDKDELLKKLRAELQHQSLVSQKFSGPGIRS